MTALIIVLVILAALLALPVGVDGAYGAEGIALALKIGPFRLTVLPGRKRKKPHREKREKKPRQSKKTKTAAGNRPDLQLILEAVRAGLRALGRFRRRLRVDLFRLRFVSGNPDPYRAAMNCAYASALLGSLGPAAGRAFRVEESRVETCVDFQAEKSVLDVRAVLSVRIWELLYVGLALGLALLGCWRRWKKRHEAAKDKGPVGGRTAEDTVKSA